LPLTDDAEAVEIKPEEEIWVEDEGTPVARPSDKTGRLMLINVAEGEECRIAILHQNRLEELFIERASAESHVGNIYKGKVTNVEPSIQAAFVDFGLPKNGFLHISDLQPQYFPGGMHTVEEVGRKTPRRERPPIQKCLRRGQEILVQIIKEGIGTKGPTLTTYISIPGRYLVMMPGMNRLGVSRRIEDEDARRKMRSILDELELPKDMGFILRTAGMDRTKRELQQDLMYLQRLWKVVARRIQAERPPCELYRESDLVIRTIRDVFSADFSRIIVDDAQTADKVRDFLSIAMPRSSAPVELYSGRRPLFHEYKLEQEIDRINSRYVPMLSGGSLVIESTEALVAIDVNSGRFRDHDDAEESAFRVNIEAAEEIARQLRLRDLGGLILCDFIDMRAEKHRRGVERALRDALKKHKERAKCLRMSQFGIIEMTRQRMRPSIKRSIYQDCPHCRGTGLVKNTESMTLDIMRLLLLATHHESVDVVEVRVASEVGFGLQNHKRATLNQLETETHRRIVIRTDENLGPDQYSFECFDQRGGIIRMDDLPDAPRSGPEARSKRRSGGGHQHGEQKSHDNNRETLEDVFD
jgi:ribonuclease E